MKRLMVIAAILITALSFEGCYSARPAYYGPRPVVVAPGYGYYRPAPVVISAYGRGYHRGWRHGGRY